MSYHLDTGSRHSPLCIYDYDDIITSKLLAGAPTKCLTPALPSAAAHSLLRRLIWDSRESVRRIHPEPATEFMCYELVESTDFGPFLAKVGSSGLECTDDKYDETGYPKFVYDVVVVRKSQSLFDTAYTNDVSTPGFNGTFEFDAVRAAEGTLYSVYEEGKTQPPTAAPTAFPTLATPAPSTPRTPSTPSAPSTSGSVSYSKKRLPISVAVGAFLVSWLVMWSMF